MYNLVKLIPHGLSELRNLLENHIYCRGHNAIEKCGDEALNVCSKIYIDLASGFWFKFYSRCLKLKIPRKVLYIKVVKKYYFNPFSPRQAKTVHFVILLCLTPDSITR